MAVSRYRLLSSSARAGVAFGVGEGAGAGVGGGRGAAVQQYRCRAIVNFYSFFNVVDKIESSWRTAPQTNTELGAAVEEAYSCGRTAPRQVSRSNCRQTVAPHAHIAEWWPQAGAEIV